MKRGNQFYLEVQVIDENDSFLDVSTIKKVQFNIGLLTKIYDGASEEVIYNNRTNAFRIWITEDETFEFKSQVKIDVRVLFNDNTIAGSVIEQVFVYDSLKEEKLYVENKDTE